MPSVGDGSSQVSSAAGSFNEGISVRPDCSHADTITPRQCSSFLSMRSASSLKTLRDDSRSEEHTSELQSLMRISYDVFCLKKKIESSITNNNIHTTDTTNTHTK